MSTSAPHQKIVAAASAGRETYWVLALIVLIALIASLVVITRQSSSSQHSLAAYQLDLRTDLTSAEQGIYADLNVVADELVALIDEGESLPSPSQLAEQGFPPFVADSTAYARGEHTWQLQRHPTGLAYLGSSQNSSLARSFLLRVQFTEQAPTIDIWLHEAHTPTANDFSTQQLIEAHWKHVSSQFNVGATRANFNN